MAGRRRFGGRRAAVLAALFAGAGLAVAGPNGGHGGGAGHTLAAGRFGPGYGRGFYGPGYGHGFYGPGFYGLGLGVGLGYGLGYGYNYGYPYPYYYGYPYAPAGYGYPAPVYVNPGCVAAPPAGGPAVAAGGAVPGGAVPAGASGPGAAGPVRLTESDVMLSIRVPPEAVVHINGTQTGQTGPRREFVSSGLVPGRSYTFDVVARWTGPDGRVVQREQRLPVQGGERRAVDFLTPAVPAELPASVRDAH
jgi:uncharacterized protein (TIGR03000 family)